MEYNHRIKYIYNVRNNKKPNINIMKNSRKLFFTIMLSFFAIFQLSAQTSDIIGKVVDDNNEPLPGVSVIIKGSKTGTATDIDGNFKIKAAPSSTLIVSFIGMKTQEIKVGNKKTMTVKLESASVELNEVVAIGYGTMKRKDITGSVASVNAEELAKAPVSNVAEALAGRIAGVNVQQTEGDPNAGISIRVRGGISITQDNEPLYIIDGFPSESAAFMALNAADIESIDVLKDASSTAIYGARGANGVVVVTTKGGTDGKAKISYDGYFGVRNIAKKLEMMSTEEFVYLDYERIAIKDGNFDNFNKFYGDFSEIGTNYANKGVNWQDEVFRTGFVQNHKVDVSGGTKELKYSASYSHLSDKGIMLESGLKKDNIRLKLDHKINKRVRVNVNLNYTNQKTEGMGTSEGEGNFGKMSSILTYQPTIGKDWSDEEFIQLPNNPWKDDDDNSIQNPKISARAEQISKELRIFSGNGGINVEILKGFTFKNSTGMLYRTQRNNAFYTSESTTAKRSGAPTGNIATSEAGRFQTSNTLQYNLRLKSGHKIDFLAGQEWVKTWTRTLGIPLSNFPDDQLGLNNISVATPGILSSSFNDDDKLLSFFGRVYYNYKDKYMLTATVRADGSSKFSKNNKWGYFPSVSAAWRLSEETFIKQLDIFSDLKLRVGYGMAGNNRISSYQSLALWDSSQTPSGNGTTPGYYPMAIPNEDLKWEANKTFNIGLDLGFFNQRLVIAPEFYINRSSNLLLNAKLPLSSGHSSIIRNIGATQNKGVDISVTSTNITNKNFTWTTTLNISHNKNKILALSDGDSFLTSSNWQKDGPSDYLVAVGEPIGLMYGYVTDGLYQVDDFITDANGQFVLDANGKYQLKPGIPRVANKDVEPGFWKYKDNGGKTDSEGNPIIDEEDKQVIGNANPKFYGGLTNTFTFKGFDLSIFLNFSYGNDVFNATKFYTGLIGQSNRTSTAIYDSSNRWITVGADGQTITDANVLRAVNAGKTVAQVGNLQSGDKSTIHSWAVEDGSFLRINNITLGYTFPKHWTSKAKISTLRIYATGNNLFTWTKYTGFDPEVSTRNSTGLTPGVDWSAYPRSRSFVFGVSLSF